jgi:membrane protease YdiL (CAAX protease family)
MTLKRFFLAILTIIVLLPVVGALAASVNQPQVQANLEIYQTNIILKASEFQLEKPADKTESDLTTILDTLIGEAPYSTAQTQYEKARKLSQNNLNNLEKELKKVTDLGNLQNKPETEIISTLELTENSLQKLQQSINQEQKFINELNLKLGILQVEQGKTQAALEIWTDLIQQSKNQESLNSIGETAIALQGLWSQPSQILANTESQINTQLDGWFRYSALKRLYQLQNRQNDLLNLQKKEQEIASQAIWKLTLLSVIPIMGGTVGVGLLIFLLVQFFLKGKQSLLAFNSNLAWKTPWNGETIWQVLIVGFFFVGQILLPLLFGLFQLNAESLSLRLKAVYVLISYLLMASGGFLVLYFSIKPFFPLPKDWFRFQWLSNWLSWGMGGYLVALPLVLLVSLINQQLWNGQGGSNPLLFLALESQDKFVLAIFFLTASIAAPLFEEIMFRGFLLPSLTRYLPVWSAIVASSLVFSLAHLNLSEVLPLTILGIILGFVYTRSRNLLSNILLHSLWNGGTLLSLVILGSG